jgi:hypothetical protein
LFFPPSLTPHLPEGFVPSTRFVSPFDFGGINIRWLAYLNAFTNLADIVHNRINNPATSLVAAMTQFTTICHSSSYSSQDNHLSKIAEAIESRIAYRCNIVTEL